MKSSISRIAFQLKYFVTNNSFSFYLFGGPSFNLYYIELINPEEPQGDFKVIDLTFGLFAGMGLDYLIGRSLSLGLEYGSSTSFISDESFKPIFGGSTSSYVTLWMNIAYRF